MWTEMENEGLGNPQERSRNNEDHSTRRERRDAVHMVSRNKSTAELKGWEGEEKGNKLEITQMEYEGRKTQNTESKRVLVPQDSPVQ